MFFLALSVLLSTITPFASPPQTAAEAALGRERVLYKFAGGADGANPIGALVADKLGTLYGVTEYGGLLSGICGAGGCGTVYKLTPNGHGYTKTTLYQFSGGADGDTPAGLVRDANGALYGTTFMGGTANAFGCGTAFKLTPSGSTYAEAVIAAFSCSGPGFYPTAGLVEDSKGNLYGTTTSAPGGAGNGASFELSPSGQGYAISFIWSYPTQPAEGSDTTSAFLFGPQGQLFGTAAFGGTSQNDNGVAFELTMGSGGVTETVLHDFTGSDGTGPFSELIEDRQGRLFGTAQNGGIRCCQGYTGGVVFSLTPSKNGYVEKTVHKFSAGDGTNPIGGLYESANGTLYGTTAIGGTAKTQYGVVFQLKPNGAGYNYDILHIFSGPDGQGPQGTLIAGPNGTLLGTTAFGGLASHAGTVYEIAP